MLSRNVLRTLCKPTILSRSACHTRLLHTTRTLREGPSRGGGSGLTNILAGEVPPPVQVKAVTDGGITLQDGLIMRSACIFLEGKVFLWDIPLTGGKQPGSLWKGWGKERFELFEVVVPKPEILILGTGKTVSPPPQELRKYLNGLGIQLEVMDTWNACTTYNLLAEEGRRVAAALFPYSLHSWKS